jgi:hypothetical protein
LSLFSFAPLTPKIRQHFTANRLQRIFELDIALASP